MSASSAQPVTTISNTSTIEVYFSMTEADVLKLSRTMMDSVMPLRSSLQLACCWLMVLPIITKVQLLRPVV